MCVCGGEGIGIDKSADCGVIIPALEVVQPCFAIVIVSAIPQRIQCTNLTARGICVNRDRTPGIIAVSRHNLQAAVHQCYHIALLVEDVIVEHGRGGSAAQIGEAIGLIGFIIEEIQRLITPRLPHDQAVERIELILRAVNGLAAADARHIISVGRGDAADLRRGELAALLPGEIIMLSVEVADGVAGDIAVGCGFVGDVLAGAADLHLGQTVLPHAVAIRQRLGRCRAAGGRALDGSDVARRVVTVVVGIPRGVGHHLVSLL